MRERYENAMKSFNDIIPTRQQMIGKASAELDPYDPMRELAKILHPDKVYMVIDEITEETKDTKTFKFVPDKESGTEKLPYFRAGQYISIKAEVNGSKITRPYSLSSSPHDALKRGFYTITIRKKEGGFFTQYIWENWKVGTKVESSSPLGFFYYHPVRDAKNVIGLAGGSGITPMRSFARDIIEKDLDINFTLFYGIEREDEIIFKEELDSFEKQSNGKVKVVYVCNHPCEGWDGCTGYLSAELIKEQVDVEDRTFIICGPKGMYDYLDGELAKLNIPRRRIRKEAPGEANDITKYPDYPQDLKDEVFNIVVHIGTSNVTIPAKATDTILVSLEKAGIASPSECRSGECGFCRSKLIAGDVYIKKDVDGRRIADKMYGYIHPCSTYPTENLEIEIPLIQRD
ncbi:iron-sulfur cluster-binding domain-containing protein [Sporanaerobacter acetigenes]|uniref:Ferredoxin-NADP reductase n=1 Tax=Sporanaerobacter acetigenes DSM 13106 TaxID=1123281 RepID=A0A1M5VIH8_9FIRM|nr:iron-sulfur cluster-binding domain-containing protein [Sporanaerobacter acetigenes]SHH75056.1 Ferredoxin-NADP reductase [Sporanaerobacter acetigenes DSM 13106]